MKHTNLVGLLAAPLMAFILGLPAHAADSGAPTTCKDGTTSTATGRGACSGHGGVQKAASTKAAPAAAAPAAPAASGTPTTCKDGTTSTASGRGACSGHGGVQKASKGQPASDESAAAPATAPTTGAPAAAHSSASKSAPTATPSNTDPTGATAKCKDGTYSKSKHRSGTCSSHGGVAEWLTSP